MTTEARAADVTAYAADVRAALADMPEEERIALLEDLDDHLAEIAADAEETLAERLGPPAQYAAELRAAYGAAHPPAQKGRAPFRGAVTGLRARLAQSDWYREVCAFLPSLRPAWWVFRGYSVALFLTIIFSAGNDVRPIPSPFHSRGLLELILTVVAVVVSVRLGQRFHARSDATRLLGVLGNTAIAVLMIPMLGSMGTNPGYSGGGVSTPDPNFPVQGAYAGGMTTNLYPYSKDGKPLSDVVLYDQDGRPLVVPAQSVGLTPTYPTGADGQPITNAYPLSERNPDGTPVQRPRVAIPPWSTPSPSPSPSPTATP